MDTVYKTEDCNVAINKEQFKHQWKFIKKKSITCLCILVEGSLNRWLCLQYWTRLFNEKLVVNQSLNYVEHNSHIVSALTFSLSVQCSFRKIKWKRQETMYQLFYLWLSAKAATFHFDAAMNLHLSIINIYQLKSSQYTHIAPDPIGKLPCHCWLLMGPAFCVPWVFSPAQLSQTGSGVKRVEEMTPGWGWHPSLPCWR